MTHEPDGTGVTLVAMVTHSGWWHVYDADSRRVGRVRPGPHERFWGELRRSASGYVYVGHYETPTEAGAAVVEAAGRLRDLRMRQEEARREVPA